MPIQSFEFELYRLNLVQEPPLLFKELNRPVYSDDSIVSILKHAQLPDIKIVFAGSKNTFEWVVREFVRYHHNISDHGPVYGITIAKSVTESVGEVVTDTGIEEDVSEPDPPLAATGRIFFYMQRHLIMVERNSQITYTKRWRDALVMILKEAAKRLEFTGWMEFEPVPRHEEIFETFRSFDVLTRLRVILRLPNPDLSRHSKDLYDRMSESKIREYQQEMKNPNGLSKKEDRLPYASLEMASLGYKKDEVTMEGFRNNRFDTVKTGGDAARGTIIATKEQMRSTRDAPEDNNSKQIIAALLMETDRLIAPRWKDTPE